MAMMIFSAPAVHRNMPVVFFLALIVNAFFAFHVMMTAACDFFKTFARVKIFSTKITKHMLGIITLFGGDLQSKNFVLNLAQFNSGRF